MAVLHPEGSAWIAARFKNNKLQSIAHECNANLHQAANDSWADIVPQDTDVEIDGEEIVLQVMGKDVDPTLVVVTCPAPEYTLHLRDDSDSTHEVTFTDKPDISDIHSECEDWVKEGEWGDEGAAISVGWTLEENGEEIDDGWYTVDIEPNEKALISGLLEAIRIVTTTRPPKVKVDVRKTLVFGLRAVQVWFLPLIAASVG